MIRAGFYPWIIFFDKITSEFRNSETRVTGFLIFFPEHPVYRVQKMGFPILSSFMVANDTFPQTNQLIDEQC